MIKGTTVGLRAIEEKDLAQLMHWRNNPELRRFFRETQEISTQQQQKWFELISDKNSNHKMFAIIELSTNQLLGACGLCYIDWVNRSADFSIYIGYQDLYIDDIYAIDASKLLIDYGFGILNLHRLWSEIYSIDSAKQTFFQKLGFTLDGALRETYWYEKKWHDSLFYSLLSSDRHKGLK